jgi:glycosyltransferase involved in cell wall biosynthesis
MLDGNCENAESRMSMSSTKIAFLTQSDPYHRHSWSGILFYMLRALENHCGQIVSLGPVGESWLVKAKTKVIRRTVRVLFRKDIDDSHTIILSKAWASIFRKRLAASGADIVFAPVASTELAFLKTELPVVYFSDLTARLYRNYFTHLVNLSTWSLKQTETIEARALYRADHVVYPSEWAAHSAIQDYGVPNEKISVFPMGANIDELPTRDEIAAARNRKQEGQCRLLFIGRDWERKGGDIALGAMRVLRAHGINATLTVVGCSPSQGVDDANLHVIPFLDKNILEQRRKLNELLLESAFMLFPTRRDASPVVCGEASAFGLPLIVPDIGGLAVWQGQNGVKLHVNASPTEYANVVESLWYDPVGYRTLAASARRTYEERLNWDAWGRSMSSVFNQVMRRTQGQLSSRRNLV